MSRQVIEVTGDSLKGADWALVRLRVEGERIVEADADGLAEPLAGLSLLEAAAVGGETLPVDALANALGPIFRARRGPGRVAVALSGGVDSAVALLHAGPEAIGVTLRLWLDPHGPDAERACCSPAAVIAAREICHARGLPHVTLDLREDFRRAVVEAFVRGYARGETPNPCVRCNGAFRFGALLGFARRAGAGRLATGHYARIVERDGRLLLSRAEDRDKDQSYMLARVHPRRLERIWFPLGEQRKYETRAEAERAGLAVAANRESQEACFLAGGDYRSFLARHGLPTRGGAIVDESGREVGRHGGFWGYTPGQRRGLGLSAAEPLYAVATQPELNQVIVGPRDSLARRRITVDGRLFAPAEHVEVKVRYRSPAVAGVVEPRSRGFQLALDEPVYGVAPGQAAVLYDNDAVVGAGVIRSARA